MKLQMEIKKVEKLINEKGYIPITDGNRILLVVNKRKQYKPKHSLMVI